MDWLSCEVINTIYPLSRVSAHWGAVVGFPEATKPGSLIPLSLAVRDGPFRRVA